MARNVRKWREDTVCVTTRLTKKEKAMVESLSASLHITPSTYIRNAVVRNLNADSGLEKDFQELRDRELKILERREEAYASLPDPKAGLLKRPVDIVFRYIGRDDLAGAKTYYDGLDEHRQRNVDTRLEQDPEMADLQSYLKGETNATTFHNAYRKGAN